LIAGLLLGALQTSALSQAVRVDSSQAAPDAVSSSRRNAIVRAVEHTAQSVVGVTTTTFEEYVTTRDPFWEFVPPEVIREKTPHVGSGFVIRKDGYILTNHHVVEGAAEIHITFQDGRQFEVEDVREQVLVDRQTDLAVIKIDATDLPVADLGDSDDVIIGEWAIAIGNPFGLLIEDPRPTVTVGVVSAVKRDFRPDKSGRVYTGMIQTDASINPGNSGGPLVNSDGQVIGVNTFIFSSSGGSLGIGFAIPINRAAEVANRLIAEGRQEFWTGFWLHPNLTPWLARALGLLTAQGALITRVEDDSPASKARLRPGDLIVIIDRQRIRSDDDVVRALREGRVGEAYELTILRGRRRFTTRLVLEEAPSD
jgi:serine protease Do